MDSFDEIMAQIFRLIYERPTEIGLYSDAVSFMQAGDPQHRHGANILLRKRIGEAMYLVNPSGCEELARLTRMSLLQDAPHFFDEYCQFMEFDRPAERRFYLPRRNTLLPIVQAFQDVHDGKLAFLTVSQPKRTGKTTLGELFGSFRAGNAPLGSSLFCGAKNGIAEMFMLSFWQLVDPKGEYNFHEVFPNIMLTEKSEKKQNIHLERVKVHASIQCRSIHGDITGTTEASPDGMLYMDDMVENEEEAISYERLEKRWDEIRGDLMGRALQGCPIVIQGTRYSIFDPIGHLQDYAEEIGATWRAIEIPALDPVTDESNFEITIDGRPRFTTDYYRDMRTLYGENDIHWASQYQQQPFEPKGRLFPEESLNRFIDTPDREPDAIVAVCDTAERGSDFTAMVIAEIYGTDVFIVDVVFDPAGPDVTKPECASAIIRNSVGDALFEANNAGRYYARDVGTLVKSKGSRCGIREKVTTTNKQTRIIFASDTILKHFWFRDQSSISRGSQYWAFIQNLVGYTRTGKVKHDDAPDVLSLLENELREIVVPKAQAIARPC